MTAYKLITKLIAAEAAGKAKKAELLHLALLGLIATAKPPFTIAVDFDGTLCEEAWPAIGPAKQENIEKLQRLKGDYGVRLVLNTCREGAMLENATTWCKTHGVPLDKFNENLPERIAFYGGNCLKISADEYWDNKGVQVE